MFGNINKRRSKEILDEGIKSRKSINGTTNIRYRDCPSGKVALPGR